MLCVGLDADETVHRRVDAGSYGQSIREYNFIHNDFLDIWVKLGVPGVLLQAALFFRLSRVAPSGAP